MQDGDIVNIDITAFLNGVHGDTNATFLTPGVSQEVRDLVDRTREALRRAINAVKPGRQINVIGRVIESYAKRFGYGVVREFTGHGIGTSFHSGLVIPHFDDPHYNDVIEPGMTFTIEPMLNLGTHEWDMWDDNWTVVTRDGQAERPVRAHPARHRRRRRGPHAPLSPLARRHAEHVLARVARVTSMFEDYATGMGAAYDEMYDAAPRSARRTASCSRRCSRWARPSCRRRVEALQSSYLDQGVTFDIGGEERAFPLDVLPRVIEMDQWAKVEAGRAAAGADAGEVPRRRLRRRAGARTTASSRAGSSPPPRTSTARPPASSRPTACACTSAAST